MYISAISKSYLKMFWEIGFWISKSQIFVPFYLFLDFESNLWTVYPNYVLQVILFQNERIQQR